MPIPEIYKQQSYSTENNCMWLSTALVVRSFDDRDGQYMIDLFLKNEQKFEWMRIKGNKMKDDHHSHEMSIIYGTETLQEKLQRDIGYYLKKVLVTISKKYLNQKIDVTKTTLLMIETMESLLLC